MNPVRRAVMTEYENNIPDFNDGDRFARILSCKAGDLFEVEIPSPSKSDAFIQIQARLLPKFRNVIWAKKGDLVILSPVDSSLTIGTNSVPYNITAILSHNHTKALCKDIPISLLPEKYHKYLNQDVIQQDVSERFLSMHTPIDSDDDEGELPANPNHRRRPFDESSSDEDDDSDD